MSNDIRISINLPRHPKYKRLKRLLGQSPMEYLVSFWCYVASYAPTGDLKGWCSDDIEEAAEWTGEPGEFFRSMIEVEMLDETENGFCPHDWSDHQPWVVGSEERSKSASNAAKAKWNKIKGLDNPQCGIDAQRMRPAQNPQCGIDAPSPTPIPTPLKEEPFNNDSSLTEVVETDSAREAEIEKAVLSSKISINEFRVLFHQATGYIMPGGLNNEASRLCSQYPRDKLEDAFLITAEQGGKTLKYVKQVLAGKPRDGNGRGNQPKTFEQIRLENIKAAMKGAIDDARGLDGIQFLDG